MPGRFPRSLAIAIPPLRTIASATAEPMPPAAPVMRMTLSRKRPILNSRCYGAPCISNIAEFSMPALAGGKARGARRAFAFDHAGGARPFGAQTFHFAQALLQPHGTAIR